MNKKNRKARNIFIARFIRIAAVIVCTGTAAAGILYSWAQMKYIMTGEKMTTVSYSIFEFFTGDEIPTVDYSVFGLFTG